jgi:hypothetical protein
LIELIPACARLSIVQVPSSIGHFDEEVLEAGVARVELAVVIGVENILQRLHVVPGAWVLILIVGLTAQLIHLRRAGEDCGGTALLMW